MKMSAKYTLMGLFLMLSLTHCATYDFARRPVQQGNLLPQSLIERLKIGMSKEDSAILMGTSLLSPTFNDNRWDYAYTWRRGNGPLEIHHLTLFFQHGVIARIERN